jgi:hypothetical protein
LELSPGAAVRAARLDAAPPLRGFPIITPIE